MGQRYWGHPAGQEPSRRWQSPSHTTLPPHPPTATSQHCHFSDGFLLKTAISSWAWAGDGLPTVCASWFGLSITKCSGIFLEPGVGKNLLLSGPKAWLVFRGKQETRP